MFQSRIKKRFLELYEPCHIRFERFCNARAYGTMDAKDLMHDSIVIALEKFNQFEQKASFLSFLCGIAIRVLANKRRKTHEYTLEGAQDNYASSENPEMEFAIAELYEALLQLPEIMRESLILFEITGFSIKEIAAMHDSSEEAVKQRLVRGRKQLARLLKDEPILIESN